MPWIVCIAILVIIVGSIALHHTKQAVDKYNETTHEVQRLATQVNLETAPDFPTFKSSLNNTEPENVTKQPG